jgi:hypothetical protein
MMLAFCWAHLRRPFYDRAVADASPIANDALQNRRSMVSVVLRPHL